MDKFSLKDIKKLNYSGVYHYIYQHDLAAKQAIANDLSMSLPTVTQHLNTLLEKGLIVQNGSLNSSIGRKATAYSIVADSKLTIGVEILKQRLTIVGVDLRGNTVNVKTRDIPYDNSDSYYQAVSKEILSFIHDLNVREDQVLGIGFGLQGLVSQDGEEIIYGKVLGCTGITIRVFKQYLDYPCRFVHDAECAAICELWDNPQLQDAMYLSLGYHMGGALIINGAVSNGRTGRTGTIEHMTLVPDGLDCYCGQKGCVECYCSALSLLTRHKDLESFFQDLQAQKKTAQNHWRSYLEYLAITINNLHMTIDCDIILGGHVAPYLQSTDLDFLHRRIREITAFPEHDTFIFLGARKKHAVSIGAALPYIRTYLEQI
ncbi:MAG: ROK family transcriptional regulator [Lachnospiraceae bacterium]|nr:ROK family transcriptional regulator [Lachnospiraceae bacterium]